jgi:Immunity protein Imm5
MLTPDIVIKTAIDCVENHPNHHLEIGIRRSIWLLMGSDLQGEGIKDVPRNIRFRLSVMCSEYVRNIYNEYFNNNINTLNLYSEGINVLSAYWREEITLEEIRLFADKFYQELENLGSTYELKSRSLEQKLSHKKAFYAMSSVWECLRVSLYNEPFNEQIESNVKDTDVDYYDYDAAYCASIAYAGSLGDLENSNREKRFEFWMWWLEEAIPKVLSS